MTMNLAACDNRNIPPLDRSSCSTPPLNVFTTSSLTVEALVGTLRAARKQRKITYDGEMLFQGVHDEVVISIVEGQ